MTYAKDKLKLGISEKHKVVYEIRSWFIFSWYVKVSTEKIGDDLFIESPQTFDEIFLNGEELVYKLTNPSSQQ